MKTIVEQFEHPQLGKGAKDPTGLIWFPVSKFQVNQHEAQLYAESLGMRLPNAGEIENAISHNFNLGNQCFWSARNMQFGIEWGSYYSNRYKFIDEDVAEFGGGNARCVIHETEWHLIKFKQKLEELL